MDKSVLENLKMVGYDTNLWTGHSVVYYHILENSSNNRISNSNNIDLHIYMR